MLTSCHQKVLFWLFDLTFIFGPSTCFKRSHKQGSAWGRSRRPAGGVVTNLWEMSVRYHHPLWHHKRQIFLFPDVSQGLSTHTHTHLVRRGAIGSPTGFLTFQCHSLTNSYCLLSAVNFFFLMKTVWVHCCSAPAARSEFSSPLEVIVKKLLPSTFTNICQKCKSEPLISTSSPWFSKTMRKEASDKSWGMMEDKICCNDSWLLVSLIRLIWLNESHIVEVEFIHIILLIINGHASQRWWVTTCNLMHSTDSQHWLTSVGLVFLLAVNEY